MIRLLRWSRSFHRWIAYGAGAIVALWTITGIVMVLPPASTTRPLPAAPVDPARAIRTPAEAAQELPPEQGPVRSVTLRDIGGRLVYHFLLQNGSSVLVDAATAVRVDFSDSLARAIAHRVMLDSTTPYTMQHLAQRDRRYPIGALPAYRIALRDARRTLIHIAVDGSVSSTSDRSRMRAVMGALHEFQLPGGRVPDRARKLLLVGAGVVTIVLILTGYVLTLPLRRRT